MAEEMKVKVDYVGHDTITLDVHPFEGVETIIERAARVMNIPEPLAERNPIVVDTIILNRKYEPSN